MPNHPDTFGEARESAKVGERETGMSPRTVANPVKGLLFDLENSAITRAVWDEDNNLVEMTYCAVTGSVLKKMVTKPLRSAREASALGTSIGKKELLAIDLVVRDRGLSFGTRKPVDEGLPLLRLHIRVLRRVNEDHAILVEQLIVAFD